MPSFADSIFLFVLALLLFGPKKLPVLARELGKWVGEFRRASNEFRMQMEEELRISEQTERQKQIAAMEAAAPLPPPLEEPEHPHLPRTAAPEHTIAPPSITHSTDPFAAGTDPTSLPASGEAASDSQGPAEGPRDTADGVRPLPIATAGDLQMMPPATGLPTPRARNANPLGGLLESIPETAEADEPAFAPAAVGTAPEAASHGD